MAVRTWTGASSDNNWGTAGNWQEGVAPVTGDSVYIRNNAVNISAGLNQSAITLANLVIDQTYTGLIGTGTAYLRIGATAVLIGSQSSSSQTARGSGRIMIDFGTVQTSVTVLGTASQSFDSGLEPIRLIGTSTSNVLYVQGGRVGIGTNSAAESPVFSAVSVTNSNGTLDIGSGATITTATVSSGTLNGQSSIGTLNQSGGTVNIQGNVTITTCNLYKGAAFTTVNGSPTGVTFTNGIRLQQCGLSDVSINLGQNYKISIAA